MSGSITKVPGSNFKDGHDRRRAVYRDHLGKQHVKQFRTLADAQAWLDQVTHDKVAGIRMERSRQTLSELYDELHAGRPYAPKTLDLHEDAWNHVPERIQQARISDIDAEAVDAVLAAVGKPAARDQVRKLLSTMFTEAVNKRRLSVNPAKRSPRRRTRTELVEERRVGRELRILDDDELHRFITETPVRYRCMIRLMAYVGLRPGEAYALTVGQFNLDGSLRIDRSIAGPTKTGQVRVITLPKIVAEWIVNHVEEFVPTTWDDPAAPLFGVRDANNFRRRVFAPAAKRAQLAGLRPNDLRHAAVARAIGNGADVYAVQTMLGHSQASTTLDIYGRLWHRSADRLAAKLDEAIRAGNIVSHA
jgi:integrase